MKRMVSVVVIATLFASGVPLGAQTSGDFWIRYTEKLPIGSTIRIRTTDGARMTAVLAIVDDTGITLEPKTRVPEPPRHIPFERIEQLELKENGVGVGKAIAIGVGAGAATFFGILLVMVAAYAD
jgi:hypothetical protein